MSQEIEQVEDQVVEEDLSKLDDSTDWKGKAQELEQKRREEGIRHRERTKALKERLASLETKPTEKPNLKTESPTEFGLLQKSYLRSAGIVEEGEVELAKRIQKETNLEWDKLIDSKYFKIELESLRTNKANLTATTSIRGSGAPSNEKLSAAYWQQKGTPPTAQDVPDRKARVKIIREMMGSAKQGKKFYND